MRSFLVLALALLVSNFVFSQKLFQKKISIYSSFLNSGSIVKKPGLRGDYKHTTGKKTFLLGFDYAKSFNKWLTISGGLEFSDHEIITINKLSVPPFTIYDPVTGNIQLMTIPLYLRADFLKYFFITFGTIIDLEVKNTVTNSQSGIGITGGAGVKYDIKQKFTLFAQPYYQLHGIYLFNGGANPEILLNAGIRTGFSYRF